MSELKPCPFCGGEALITTIEHDVEHRPHGYRFHGQILCRRCQASAGTTGFDSGYETATTKAITAWNRRACPTGLTPDECAELAELRKAKADGRLVELPCKVGDTVYIIATIAQTISAAKVLGVAQMGTKSQIVTDSGFAATKTLGKTWFLTRADAEAALEREGKDG